MKKLLVFCMLMVTCGHGLVLAQRSLEEIIRIPDSHYGLDHPGTVVDDVLFIAGTQALHRYDGTSFIDYEYPDRDGVSLELSATFAATNVTPGPTSHIRSLPVLGSVIYLSLEDASSPDNSGPLRHCPTYLYQYTDGVITPSPITDQTLSNVVIFQGKAYVVTTAGGVNKLVSFDGITVNEIIPSIVSHELFSIFVKNNFLYLVMQNEVPPYGVDIEVNVKRYDGLGFIDIPTFIMAGFYVREVYRLADTETVYFHSELGIAKFDGTEVTEIAHIGEEPVEFSDFALFNDDAYFNTAGVSSSTLYRYDGTSVDEVDFPGGGQFGSHHNSILNYEGRLYLIGRYLPSRESVVLSYDGSSYTPFLVGEDESEFFTEIYDREGRILVQSNKFSYEFIDGAMVCKIEAPYDRRPHYPKLNLSTSDFHIWVSNTSGEGERFLSYYREDRTATCAVTSIIPEGLAELQRIDLRLDGRERDWCWNGIDVGWVVAPTCTPPLCDPDFQVTMLRPNIKLKNKIAFQKTFDVPSSIPFGLKDKELYDLSLAVFDGQSFQNVLLVDKGLVRAGFSGIKLSMEPKLGRVHLSVETDNNKVIPFQINLLGANGKTLWVEKFTAPFNQAISASLIEPGATLRFSPTTTSLSAPVSNAINVYPNPFAGKLVVEIDSEDATPAVLTMFSLQGEMVYQSVLDSSGKHSVDIGPKKQGLYILSIKVGDSEVRKLVELRY
jgi:hypothetical protein